MTYPKCNTTARHLLHAGLFLFCLSIAALGSASATAQTPALHLTTDGLIQEQGGLMWQQHRSHKMHSVTEVKAFLLELNQGKYKDWRLPTKWELYELLERFDWKQNGAVAVPSASSYWLQEKNGIPHPGAWIPNGQCGIERSYYKNTSGYVWAVRP